VLVDELAQLVEAVLVAIGEVALVPGKQVGMLVDHVAIVTRGSATCTALTPS
jgi:hypothetical protein